VKDITSTTFGLLIAYLLPGMAGLYSLRYFSTNIKDLFKAFTGTNANVGLFFLVIFLAITFGLIITALRWVVYECILCKSMSLTNEDYEAIGINKEKLIAFRAATDEIYRYHQFFGGMTFAMPLFVAGWFIRNYNSICDARILCYSVGFIAIWIVLVFAAIVSYKRYVTHSKSIMGG